MRRLQLALVISALVLPGCGPRSLLGGQAYGRFVGTWQNREAELDQPFARIAVQPDYIVKFWLRVDSPAANKALSAEVKRTWVDTEGGICCQFYFTYVEGSKGQGLGLMRLDKARQTLELNMKYAGKEDLHPEQIERKMPGEKWTWYMLFFRGKT